MRAGREVRQGFVLAIEIRDWATMLGMLATHHQHTLLRKRSPMHGASMICTEMSGNGVRTGMGIIHPAMLQILKVHQVARTGWSAAVAGAAMQGPAGRLIVTTLPRSSGASFWAFALPGHSNF